MRKVRKLIMLLAQAGPARIAYVAGVSYLLPSIMSVLSVYAGLHGKVKKIWQWVMAGSDLAWCEQHASEILARGRQGYRLPLQEFGLTVEGLEAVRAALRARSEVTLGEFDQDGFLLSRFGRVEGARTIEADRFFVRKRFALSVVTAGADVGVRKYYRGDLLSFVTELKALHALAVAGCNVPAIMAIDFSALTITFSYIKGRELRLELADRGAVLLDRDILHAPGYDALSPEQRRAQQVEQGRPYLASAVTPEFIEGVFQQLRAMHRVGFVWKDLKYGNIMIVGDQPYLIDFDTAYDHARTHPWLRRLLIDQNIEEFNRCFGTNKLTYHRIRTQLASEAGKRTGYSSAYFGYGLRSGNILKNYVGDGRWHFIMRRHIPALQGARLLDLGSNDAFHSLQALRNGAAQAIAIERNDAAIARGLWFRDAFEWTDNRRYDFRYVQIDMAAVPETDLGRFSFAMALCSIYYLDDAGIARLVKHLSTIAPTLLLMCNTEHDIGRTDPDEYTRASVAYTVAKMTANGFPATTVVAPGHYSRPLVIGRRAGV